MKAVLIHTHFHKRRTGLTRSIENVLPFFSNQYETYLYGYGIEGVKISTLKLKSILFSNREVIVHCHRNNEIIRMLLFRFLGAKFTLIATRHSDTIPSGLTIYLLKKADKVIALTKSMSEKLGIKNTLVGHGINVDFFIPRTNKKLDYIKEKNLILCAGRIREKKGQLILLEATKILKQNKTWALVIVGKVDKPPFLEELKIIAKKYSIKQQVYFIDETTDILSYYQASKIAVVPSYSEGFSLVALEAMSCECSVIATKNVGIHSSVIKDGKNGYLFEAGKSAELEVLLSKLIHNELPLLSKEARAEIVKNWSAEREAKNLIEIYKAN